MCLHVHAVHNHSRLPVMAHVSGTCMKDSFKLKHLLGSTASLFCLCQQVLMTPHNMRRNTKRIVPISYHFSYVILFVRPMMMLTCMTPQIIVTN